MYIIYAAFFLACATLLSACNTQHTTAWLESKYIDKTSSFVTIDGNRIHYRDDGISLQREAIILLHGTASSLHAWDQWTEVLTDRYRVVRMDLPGFGLSGPDRANRYEIHDDVLFLSKLLQHLNIQHAHIVGSSLGGRIAWQYALEFPEQISSLTLINALGYPQVSWPAAIEMGKWPVVDKLMEIYSPRFMYGIGLKEVYFDTRLVNDELIDRYFELSRYPGNLSAFPRRVKARLDKDFAKIKGITVPTLILWGENDLYFPVSNAHRFKSDIAQSLIHTYPNVGHLPMEEVPQQSVKHFSSFINTLDLVYENSEN